MKTKSDYILDFLFCGGLFGLFYVIYIILWAIT